MMLITKYQGSGPYGFRQEDFFMFLPIKVYAKHVTPNGGSILAPPLRNFVLKVGGVLNQVNMLVLELLFYNCSRTKQIKQFLELVLF